MNPLIFFYEPHIIQADRAGQGKSTEHMSYLLLGLQGPPTLKGHHYQFMADFNIQNRFGALLTCSTFLCSGILVMGPLCCAVQPQTWEKCQQVITSPGTFRPGAKRSHFLEEVQVVQRYRALLKHRTPETSLKVLAGHICPIL
jgi:hypothetical protein